MAPDTHGRVAARPARTLIREDQTRRGRCCASSSSTAYPQQARDWIALRGAFGKALVRVREGSALGLNDFHPLTSTPLEKPAN
jgi:hypothetical protein